MSTSLQPSTKKRKRAAVEAEDAVSASVSTISAKSRTSAIGNVVTIRQSTQPTTDLGPVLVNFPAIEPPASTPFSCYELAKKPHEKKKRNYGAQEENDVETEVTPFSDRKTIIAGETANVEFVTEPLETEQIKRSSGCTYMVGIYNKRTNTTVIRPAPLHLLTRTIKAHKALAEDKTSSTQPFQEAKTTLGNTFGTKKAKAAIRAAERNKVDVSAMEGVVGFLQKGIENRTAALPTVEQAKEAHDSARLIPPINVEAETPEDVYPLHSIIPETEWNSIPVSAFFEAHGFTDRLKILPYARSEWVNSHVQQLLGDLSSIKRRHVKILYYIAAMLLFKRIVGTRSVTKDHLCRKMEGVPLVIAEGLLSRFTELPRESSLYQPTTQTQTLLQTNMFALCLKLDSFVTDPTLIAKDLAMAVQKIHVLFKSLGCKVKTLTEQERLKRGLPESSRDAKMAVLKCPVILPHARTSGRKNARK